MKAAQKPNARTTLRLIDSPTFNDSKYALRWLVQSIFAAGQPAVVGGPKKSLKTSLILDMAISLGTGQPFLGRFKVPRPCRVIVLSGESGKAVIQATARRICETKGVSLDKVNCCWGFRLPRLAVSEDLSRLKASVKATGAQVVFIDPLYLALLDGSQGIEANNLYQVGPVLRRAAGACLEAGATPVFVHHTVKGVEKPKARKSGEEAPEDQDLALDLNALAFAGIGEFARQWLLVRHRRLYEPGASRHELLMSVGGSAGHTGLWRVDVDEGVLDERFQGREWKVNVQISRAIERLDKSNRLGALD